MPVARTLLSEGCLWRRGLQRPQAGLRGLGACGSFGGPAPFPRVLFLFSVAPTALKRRGATLSCWAQLGSITPPDERSVLGCRGQSCAVTQRRRERKANLESGGTGRQQRFPPVPESPAFSPCFPLTDMSSSCLPPRMRKKCVFLL